MCCFTWCVHSAWKRRRWRVYFDRSMLCFSPSLATTHDPLDVIERELNAHWSSWLFTLPSLSWYLLIFYSYSTSDRNFTKDFQSIKKNNATEKKIKIKMLLLVFSNITFIILFCEYHMDRVQSKFSIYRELRLFSLSMAQIRVHTFATILLMIHETWKLTTANQKSQSKVVSFRFEESFLFWIRHHSGKRFFDIFSHLLPYYVQVVCTGLCHQSTRAFPCWFSAPVPRFSRSAWKITGRFTMMMANNLAWLEALRFHHK